MKTKFLLPMAAVAIGMLSAFGTMKEEKGASAPVWGFSHKSVMDPCHLEIQCGNNGGDICTANGFDLYGEEAPGVCPNPLTRNN